MNIITLSVSRILEVVYAETALRHLLSDDRPAMLHPDRRQALVQYITSAFADMCIALIPAISDCNIDDCASADMLTISVDLPAACPSSTLPALRLSIERAIARKALADIYDGVDAGYAASLLADFDRSVVAARRLIGLGRVPSIRPHWL